MTTTIQVYEPEAHNALVQRNAAIMELRENMFIKGIHYGEPYKNAGKPTLFKPGAETIMSRFKLWPKFIERSMVEQWDQTQPLFHYRYECQLIHRETGEVWGAGIGSCNSMEDKYGWRWVSEADIPSGLDKSTLDTRGGTLSEFSFAVDKAETTGQYGKDESYWQMYKDAIANGTARKIQKETRNGKKYDAWEIDATEYRIPNTNVFTITNTIDKMAQKRAFVAAVLVATGASAYFTQDVEDFPGYAGEIIDADYTVSIDEYGEVVTPDPTEATVSIPENDEPSQQVATHRKASKPAQKRAEKPTAPSNGNDAVLPTIRQYWPDVASGLMAQPVAKLVADGINVGLILYGPKHATIQRLGYESPEEFKRKAGLESSKDYKGTLEELLNTAIIHSPAA